MQAEIASDVKLILGQYDPADPKATADALERIWLNFEPRSTGGIKADLKKKQKTVGTPVPVLKKIGKTVGSEARKRVADYVPLAQTLWDEYGREGRVVGLVFLGPMELEDPWTVVPLLYSMCRSCVTWEDADRLAMDALEPIVRKRPEEWLGEMGPWLVDDNKWVRRAGVIVVGRLPMKHPSYTGRCLEMVERLLADEETDVKKAVSFAIRLCARGEAKPVCSFLERHIPPDEDAATWVLCDAIRSMGKKLLPEFRTLLPRYEAWAQDPALSARDRRSVESAVKTLRKVS